MHHTYFSTKGFLILQLTMEAGMIVTEGFLSDLGEDLVPVLQTLDIALINNPPDKSLSNG